MLRLKKVRPKSAEPAPRAERGSSDGSSEELGDGLSALAQTAFQAVLDPPATPVEEMPSAGYRGIPVRFAPPEVVFRRAGEDWEAWVEHDGYRVQVLAEDSGGHPSSEFVSQVEAIVQELAALESIARISEPELATRLTPDHRLALVSETHPKADFALGFAGPVETVIVDFKNGDVFSWCFLAEPGPAEMMASY